MKKCCNNRSSCICPKSVAHIVYLLQALGVLTLGIIAVASVILAYIKISDARGTWIESHFRWQISTFWFGLLWTIVGGILCLVFIGYIILLANVIWVVYRIIRGWVNLADGSPVGNYACIK